MLGVAPGARVPTGMVVEMWLGISTDEAGRMKPSESPWISHRWPLIDGGMSRRACLAWLERHGYPIPGNRRAFGARITTTRHGGR